MHLSADCICRMDRFVQMFWMYFVTQHQYIQIVLQNRSILYNSLNSTLLCRATQWHCYCLRTTQKERCPWGSCPLGGKNQLKKKLLFATGKIMYCPLWGNKLWWWQWLRQVRDGHSAQRTAWAADGNCSISLTHSPITPLRKISYLKKEVTHEKVWQNVMGISIRIFFYFFLINPYTCHLLSSTQYFF